jgi:hypothetical protein
METEIININDFKLWSNFFLLIRGVSAQGMEEGGKLAITTDVKGTCCKLQPWWVLRGDRMGLQKGEPVVFTVFLHLDTERVVEAWTAQDRGVVVELQLRVVKKVRCVCCVDARVQRSSENFEIEIWIVPSLGQIGQNSNSNWNH